MVTADVPGGASTPGLPRSPHEFPRRILLATLGLNPQVLTETLYALAVPAGSATPPFVPTAIQVVTTVRGRDHARRTLLARRTGHFFRFCADYRIDPRAIGFDHRSFLVVEREGRPLADVTTTADHAAVAETVVRLVRRLTADDEAAVHASLAGGRRTMGLYLAHALSLYGRSQDRLSHVIVDSRFAAADGFYYPPPTSAAVVIRDRRVNTSDARVTLADVPVLRLREELPLSVIDDLPPPGAMRTRPPRAAASPTLELHRRRRRVSAGSETLHLPPADFAFYALMARRRAGGRDYVNYRTPGLAGEYLREYASVTTDHWAPNAARVHRRLRDGIDREWFEQRKARVNHALRAALGAWLSRPYQIATRGRRPDTRFGLLVDPARIVFRD